MKIIYLLFTFATLILNSSVFAAIDANSGDIVIFNTPIQVYAEFQMKLLACVGNHVTCSATDLQTFAETSDVIKWQKYYVFTTGEAQKKLSGKAIYAQFSTVDKKVWTDPIVVIENFDPKESPFYQFTCWYMIKKAPMCSTGSDDKLVPD